MVDWQQPDMDYVDPSVDIHALFCHYNKLYFDNSLGAVTVQWSSKRMTRVGGNCAYQRDAGCKITLSEPLLKYRPPVETKRTLLHEMIHAYIFLAKIRDTSDHGPRFVEKMEWINAQTFPDQERPPEGYQVDVHHTMIAEMQSYQTHHWQCDRCGNVVKRATNRAPQEADCYSNRYGKRDGAACTDPKCSYHMHVKHCGGAYVKIVEPEGYGKKKGKGTARFADGTPLPAKRPKKGGAEGSVPITDFFNRIPTTDQRGAGPSGDSSRTGRADREQSTPAGQYYHYDMPNMHASMARAQHNERRSE
ncbi:hypothetical protein WJX72_001340 [[Myrmecia] bisecta]|uniref:SprT-like domain-containing protein n=1 Tax=[Myrmecia] bisecta TaxID=41462 RepID=A0AAW1Q145_9CHLO